VSDEIATRRERRKAMSENEPTEPTPTEEEEGEHEPADWSKEPVSDEGLSEEARERIEEESDA